MKDNANFFELTEDEQSLYNENPFLDCPPGAASYAQNFKNNILSGDTPQVILLEGSFGVGKTHFATRFTNYLDKNNYNAIYFSAWEQDYLPNPFFAFSKAIIKYINKICSNEKSEKVQKLFEALEVIAASVSFNTPFGYSINAKQLIDGFKGNEDPVKTLKERLIDFIGNALTSHKLIIFVDELDRCRPDVAMKTLEIIKHFFNVKGLIIIVISNEYSLNQCVKALYGIECDNDSEWYLNKFFDSKIKLYEPDYSKVIQDYSFREKLKNLIDNSILTLDSRYNSLQTLESTLAKYAKDFKLTSRELNRACNFIFAHIDNLAKTNRLDCEYIAYKICQKYSTCNAKDKILFNIEHPFSSNQLKYNLLNRQLPEDLFNINHCIIRQPFLSEYPILENNNTKNYADFQKLMLLWRAQLEKIIEINKDRPYQLRDNRYALIANNILSFIQKMTDEVMEYQKTWDSNDDDEDIKQQYDNYIDNPAIISLS